MPHPPAARGATLVNPRAAAKQRGASVVKQDIQSKPHETVGQDQCCRECCLLPSKKPNALRSMRGLGGGGMLPGQWRVCAGLPGTGLRVPSAPPPSLMQRHHIEEHSPRAIGYSGLLGLPEQEATKQTESRRQLAVEPTAQRSSGRLCGLTVSVCLLRVLGLFLSRVFVF